MKRRILASLVLLALLLSLCACGKTDEAEPLAPSVSDVETTDGWIPSRIAFPD